MPKDISIKDLRKNLADVADSVEKGESYRVIRRSKPSFYIVKIDSEQPDDNWETVVDFTENGKKTGMPIKDVMNMLKKIQKH